MATVESAAGVALRFADEHAYIGQYIRCLSKKSVVHDRQIDDLNRILVSFKIEKLPTRDQIRALEAFSAEEMRNLLAVIYNTKTGISSQIHRLEIALDGLRVPRIPKNGPVSQYPDLWAEAIDWLMENSPEEASEQHLANQVNLAMSEFDRSGIEIPRKTYHSILRNAATQVPYLKLRQQLDTLKYAEESCEDMYVLGRARVWNAEINLYRQGFLLLMTAFDAAAYDLMRAALHSSFFNLIQHFSQNDRVSIADIGKKGDFDSLKSDIIEQQIRKLSITDLLLTFQRFGAKCCNNQKDLPRLLELVLRRHLHVHNRGIVDERYIQAKYNLDKFKVGEVAPIGETYWDIALKTTLEVVDNVTMWIMKHSAGSSKK